MLGEEQFKDAPFAKSIGQVELKESYHTQKNAVQWISTGPLAFWREVDGRELNQMFWAIGRHLQLK